MAPTKSQVRFYAELCARVIACDPLGLTRFKTLGKDIDLVKDRINSEGLSFLTKSLPKLGKALDLGLNGLRFKVPEGFKRSFKYPNTPLFLEEYFNLVFDDHGYPRDQIDPVAIKHLRQVLFLAYKLELPFDQDSVKSVITSFIDTEHELAQLTFDEEASQILEVASNIVRDIFGDFDPKDILPRHGPGAVSTGEKLEDKWVFSRKFNKIHQYYPYYDYFIVGGASELIDRLQWYRSLETPDKGLAKVVLVPKDSRGPRLISCEPLEFQWVQQGLGRKIMEHLEKHPLTRGYVNFTRQSINQNLALSSSFDRSNATIDMKDASDRVSVALVERLFSKTPDLLRALMACRSDATTLPSGEIVELAKFAPMGSALCFPVEAICFWTIMVATMVRYSILNRGVSSSPAEVGQRIFVYGDDIVIPTDWVSVCTLSLEYCALRVNTDKCCVKGYFRESCGVDAYKGVDVTPLRLRTLWSGQRLDGSAYASYISFANQMARRGYGDVSQFVWETLEATYGIIPMGTSLASYPCKEVSDPEIAEEYNLRFFPHRMSGRYQRIEFNLPMISSKKVPSKLDSWSRLLRNLTIRPEGEQSTIVVPRSMSIKRGWTAVY